VVYACLYVLANDVHAVAADLSLRPEEAAVESFAAVSTPGRAPFCHYLSPAGYASGFGSPDGQAATVESWLSGMALCRIQASPGRSCVRATTTTSVIDAALALVVASNIGVGSRTFLTS
jgi:hypothetical protein